jgi:3-dehydroquinate synthase
MIRRVDVALASGGYLIRIGQGLLKSSPFLSSLSTRRCCLISDTHVAALHGRNLVDALPDIQLLEIGPGEKEKTPETLVALLGQLAEAGMQRDGCLVALGGGVVGDITGFAAATYMRGIDFVQVPTTLLAMVDASVGGKTGVNLPQGKNLMGAFYQPCAVWIDVDTLNTLPEREYRAGLAEVLKYALVLDREFLPWLEQNRQSIRDRDPAPMIDLIERCCRLKARIVEEDEKEAGKRALLNFGHTLAHAIEKTSGYGTWLHGEAVALGMLVALRLSEQLLGLDSDVRQRATDLLRYWQLPVSWSGQLPVDAWLGAMRADKKNRQDRTGYVLCPALGDGIWHLLEDTEALREACDILTSLDSEARL